MMRIAIFTGAVLLSLIAFGLYHASYLTRTQEEVLRQAEREIAREQEQIRVLKAEWSLLNQPERLQALAQRYLNLTPSGAHQFKHLASLPLRPAQRPETPKVRVEDLPKRPESKRKASAPLTQPSAPDKIP